MTTQITLYATDEDLAIRASPDFSLLCPADQTLAHGTDGVFGASDRWTLTSATVDFAAQGLTPGQVVQLLGPTANFKPPGECLVIDSVSAVGVRLRRKGFPSGVGQPPAPAGGLTGVEFLVVSYEPQLSRASYDLAQRFGIDESLNGRRSADLYDPRQLREMTVLTVLHRQYLALSREAGSQEDVLSAKARRLKEELDEVLARAVLHWASDATTGDFTATTRFSAQIAR